MDLLRKLEIKAIEYWRMANEARGLEERQKLMRRHREAHEQYRRHKEWLKAMGV